MSPYLAVIIDSFRAALASRILWVAFVAIWLLLAALAPIGYREDFTTTFRGGDFRNGTRMKAMLAQGLVDPESKDGPLGRIASQMPEDLRRQLKRVGEGDEVRIRLSALADGLNELLDDESWYDAQKWQELPRLKELRELDESDEGAIDDSLRRRRARLRIETVMPGVFENRSARSIFLTYAGLDFPANLAVDKTQFVKLINQFVLPTIINWLLGFILIFLGILVTASVVPDMLQPGSLHLLLSKPVSRSMLLISKFIGGCAFVLLCVTQLVIGLYLIAGIRLDVWNLRLLWCIPVSVFLFSVFYSVSTLAGLRWRSPILAIGVTTIFGGICLVVGVIGGLFDGLVTRPDAVQHFAVAGDDLIASTRGSGLLRLDRNENRWDPIFESNPVGQDRIIPPIALNDTTVLTAKVTGGRFNPFGSGALDSIVLSEAEEWTPEPGLRLPTATSYLFRAGDSVLALNTNDLSITDQSAILEAAGIERDKKETETETEDPPADEDSSGGWLSKLTNMMGGKTSGFESVLPRSVVISPPREIAVSADGTFLIVVSRGRLVRLDRPTGGEDAANRKAANGDAANGAWTLGVDRTIDGEASRKAVLAISGDAILVAREEEPIRIFNSTTLDSVDELLLADDSIPVDALAMTSGNRFVLLASDGRLRPVGPDKKEGSADYSLGSPFGPSEVEAIGLGRGGAELIVGHHIDKVDILGTDDFKTVDQVRPSLSSWRSVDAYVISPLRMVIPQTGELGETVAATVSGKSAVSIDNGSEEGELVRYKIARPIISCASFIFVMLGISCLYFSTRDF